jgi:hypothetical protein
MARDFSKEEQLLRDLENILNREEGRKDRLPLQTGMMDVLTKDFLKLPREKLDTIFELLEILNRAGWDIALLKQRHLLLTEHVKKPIENLKNLPNSEHASIPEAIDYSINEYRNLMYLLWNIDDLDNMVISLCNNYRIATKKLLGEN